MIKKVLISAPYLQLAFEYYKNIFIENNIEFYLPKVKERLEESDLLELINDFDGTICGDDKFTPKVIDSAKKLKVIVKWGTGIDSIDKNYAEKSGIKVFNTLNAFSEPVSDSVIAFMLNFARNIMVSDRIMKEGKWSKPYGFCLNEKTLGIIGIGNVGRAVARKARAFDMEILGNDIIDIPEKIQKEFSINMVSLEELLKKSDFVSINCDLNQTSHHLIKREQFAIMKNTSYIINTARGPIIKEEDLIHALENKQIAGAGLDVFEFEPLPVDSPLRKMDCAVLSSHNTNNSPKYWEYIHKNSIKMLLSVLNQ